MEVGSESQEVLRSSDQLTRRTEGAQVKDRLIASGAVVVSIIFAIGAAGLLGFGVNSMSTFKSLSLIGISLAGMSILNYFATPTYKEVEGYLQYLGKNEYIFHRGADKESPFKSMVSVCRSKEEPPMLLDYHSLKKEPGHSAFDRVQLLDLKKRAGEPLSLVAQLAAITQG